MNGHPITVSIVHVILTIVVNVDTVENPCWVLAGVLIVCVNIRTYLIRRRANDLVCPDSPRRAGGLSVPDGRSDSEGEEMSELIAFGIGVAVGIFLSLAAIIIGYWIEAGGKTNEGERWT